MAKYAHTRSQVQMHTCKIACTHSANKEHTHTFPHTHTCMHTLTHAHTHTAEKDTGRGWWLKASLNARAKRAVIKSQRESEFKICTRKAITGQSTA